MAISPIPWQGAEITDSRVGLACIVDVETTGLSHADEVVEIGLVLFAFNRATGAILGIADEYVGLREPTVPMSRNAVAVHGISLSQLRGKRLDHDRFEAIFTRAEVVIAHNVGFDRRFVCQLSDTARERRWLCSMGGINWLSKGCPSRRLQDLLGVYDITIPTAHRALHDAYGVLYLLSTNTGKHPFLAELLGLE